MKYSAGPPSRLPYSLLLHKSIYKFVSLFPHNSIHSCQCWARINCLEITPNVTFQKRCWQGRMLLANCELTCHHHSVVLHVTCHKQLPTLCWALSSPHDDGAILQVFSPIRIQHAVCMSQACRRSSLTPEVKTRLKETWNGMACHHLPCAIAEVMQCIQYIKSQQYSSNAVGIWHYRDL